jgi:hypothetical protein
MAFSLLELSRYGGKPIGLLRLARGNVLARFTDADREIAVDDEDYLPLAVSRSEIRDSSERRKNLVTLTLPISASVTSWWRPYPPSGPVFVTWLAMHYGDNEVAVEWTGRVIGARFTDTVLELNCEPTRSNGGSRGLNLRWQRGCPLAVYSQGIGMCNLDKADFAVPGVLTAAEGITLEADAFGELPSGRLAGGFVEYLRADGEIETRSIMAHAGNQIVLNYGTDQLEEDAEVTAYWGCPHNFAACRDLFENEPNYGGAVYMPIKSPFDGSPL